MAVNLTRDELADKQERNVNSAIDEGRFESGLADALAFVDSPSDIDPAVVSSFEREAPGQGDEFVEAFETAVTR